MGRAKSVAIILAIFIIGVLAGYLVSNHGASDSDSSATAAATGWSLYAGERYEEAVEWFDAALGHDPSEVSAHTGLGWTHYRLRQLDDAVAAFETAHDLAPHFAEPLIGLGFARLDLEEWDLATSSFEQALTIQEDSARAHNGHGWTAFHKSQEQEDLDSVERTRLLNEAKQGFQRSVHLEPNHAGSHHGLGSSLYWLEFEKPAGRWDFHNAQASLQTAIDLDPGLISARNTLARTHYWQDFQKPFDDPHRTFETAVAEFEAISSDNPEYAPSWIGLGWAHLGAGQPKQAIDTFEEGLRIAPDDVNAHAGLGEALYELGSYEAALSEFEAVLESKPDNSQALSNVGWTLLRLGQTEEAIDAFGRAIETRPWFSPFRGLGWSYLIQGQDERSRQSFERAIELNPGIGEAYLGLAYLETKQGKDSAAAEWTAQYQSSSYKRGFLHPEFEECTAAADGILRPEIVADCVRKAAAIVT